ncbi:hypothetical protein D3C78_1594020 [compost metagenome]
MRVISATNTIASVTVGSSRCRAYWPSPSARGAYPCTGSQLSLTENTRINRYATTKTGIENASTAPAMIPRSARPRCRHAASTPSGTAVAMVSRMAHAANENVGPSRALISVVTGCLD